MQSFAKREGEGPIRALIDVAANVIEAASTPCAEVAKNPCALAFRPVTDEDLPGRQGERAARDCQRRQSHASRSPTEDLASEE